MVLLDRQRRRIVEQLAIIGVSVSASALNSPRMDFVSSETFLGALLAVFNAAFLQGQVLVGNRKATWLWLRQRQVLFDQLLLLEIRHETGF